MNHTLNAKIHRYAWCPECDAEESKPCTSPGGFVREPHRVRLRLAAGEIVLLKRGDPRLEPPRRRRS
jgi:hypothetical protein